MKYDQAAQEILDTMLGYLGFVTTVEIEEPKGGPSLQVVTGEPKPLIGRGGDRLEDIQYLVNRVLQARHPEAPRVRVDIDQYRATQEFRLTEEVELLAERVMATGEPLKTEPLNSYHRRIVHNHFKDHASVETWSPSDSARLKRISIKIRKS